MDIQYRGAMERPALRAEEIHPQLWRASQLAGSHGRVIASGHAALDAELPDGFTPEQYLRQETYIGAHRRWPGGVPHKVQAQIEHELALIAELMYEPYFLTVYDIVRFTRNEGILCQGRGSAANSAVCYALGITEVDPARSSMLFERFISKERGEPPDIDVYDTLKHPDSKAMSS